MKIRTSNYRTLALSGALLAALSPLVSAAITITEYSIPTSNSIPVSIVGAPDGNLWFSEFESKKIGRMTPQGQVTEFQLSGVHANPVAITLGDDGNLWFAEGDRIGKMTTAGNL